MRVDAESAHETYPSILHSLACELELDFAFLRLTDIDTWTSILVAEWPPRIGITYPDPSTVAHRDGPDPILALAATMKDVTVVSSTEDIAEQLDGLAPERVPLVVIPLVTGGIDVGVLGFAKAAGRAWTDFELSSLRSVAALMTQLLARVDAENRSRFAATHDDLTGMSNRRALLDHLSARLEEPGCGPVGVLFLDLDQLKSLNDFLGHLTGDEYIRDVADMVRKALGPEDVIARLGGDEFVVVLAGPTDECTADLAAQTILKAIDGIDMPLADLRRRARIGIMMAQPGRITAERALRCADQAALIAKIGSTDNIEHFTESVRAQSELRSDVEVHLRDAIEGDALVLYYQPEVDLGSGKITAVEALVRWQHPVRGLLPPSAFIPVAEATNLAPALGRWVLDTACRTLSEWRSTLPSLDISIRVNVSPAQLVEPDFAGTVEAVLRRYGVEGPQLCLEITEVAVVNDVDRTRKTLHGLHQLGVRIAIDDFGTGYSALSHLKELQVDALKIDRSFVTDLGAGDANDLAIVESVVGLADAFGLDVIAEGVETTAAVDVLLALGCTRAQGYLISRPVPAAETLELLRAGTIQF